MRKWTIGRVAAAVVLMGVGMAALVRFDLFQAQLGGLSADGTVQAHSWLALRVMLIGCAGAGVVLLFWNAITHLIDRLLTALTAMRERDFVLRLLLIAGSLRIAAIAFLPLQLFADYKRYDELAQTWAATGSYADSGSLTAFWPPGYPFFLSRLYLIFGHSPQAGVIANAVLSVGIVYLTYRLARVALGDAPARLVAFALAFFPSQLLFVNLLCSDVLFTFLFMLGLWIWVEAIARNQSVSESDDLHAPRTHNWIVWSGVAGVALGLATQVRTIALLVPIIVIAAYWRSGRSNLRLAGSWVVVVAGMLIVLTPWVVRNDRAIGRATLATNSGVNFYIGNNPNSAMGCNQPQTDIVAMHDEGSASATGYRLGWEYIRAHPGAFVKRAILKTGFLMGSDTEGMWYRIILAAQRDQFDRFVWLAVFAQAVYLGFLLLFVAGLVALVRARDLLTPGVRVFLYIIVYWVGVHAVFFGDGRFRFPIMPLMMGIAALGLLRIVDRPSGI